MRGPSARAVTELTDGTRRTPPDGQEWLFGSFFLGGFECSNHVGRDGRRHDLIAETQHDSLAAEDFALCRAAGMEAVRESARWPFAERSGRLDLGHIRHLARLAQESRLALIWDLFHYGYPDDLDDQRPGWEDRLLERFATFAHEVATVVKAETSGPRWYTPVNEPSYSGWACGEVGYMAPFWHDRGLEYKRLLVRLQIAAVRAIDTVDPEARILSVDPLVRLHVHPEISDVAERTTLQAVADDYNSVVVPQAFDMLAGLVEPELGGSARVLGVAGLNYYDGNQWTIPTPRFTRAVLAADDPAAIPLAILLQQTAERYQAPVILAETGASAEARVPWLRLLTAECSTALARGVDLQGVCIYPVVTSPDWDDQTAFFDGGLFDVAPMPDGKLERRIMRSVRDAFLEA
ncbi:MAG: family 1 glycosylhydrolase, partial [Chloroflexi bacterium]|nr:family 1 glycosylhydrolase [Chloroflexota bacterium]